MSRAIFVYGFSMSFSAAAFITFMFAFAPLWVAVLSLIGSLIGVVKLTFWILADPRS